MDVPVVVVTRCGIGVFDEQWWKSRLNLFKAITLPSLSRFAGPNFHWFIAVDAQIPDWVYEELQSETASSGRGSIKFTFVDNPAYLRDTIYQALKSVVSPSQRFLAMKIDDDDAVGADFFQNVTRLAKLEPDAPAVISLARGRAFNAPEKLFGTLDYPSHPSNTVFYGTLREVNRVFFGNHVRWLSQAAKIGFRSIESYDYSDQFLYTYHHQGDGSYEKRVAAVSNWQAFSNELVDNFGINESYLDTWLEIQETLPPTLGLTWRRAQGEMWQMAELKRQMTLLKNEVVRLNSHIFDPDIPFIYTLSPGESSELPKGQVTFKGVSNPGATVILEVAGRGNTFKKMSEATSARSDGAFIIRGNFNSGDWRIRLIVLLEELNRKKELEFKIKIG